MDLIFEAVDPRGYRVVCTKDIWHNKILQKRPWMAGWEDEVQLAIEDPSLPICKAASHDDRLIYYRRLNRINARYIRVVVAAQSEEIGYIISAYPCDSGKSGEKAIWPE